MNRLVFDKHFYCGISILDNSKTLVYDLHYNYIKKKYGECAKLLSTNTNILMCEIETEGFFEDLSGNVPHQ